MTALSKEQSLALIALEAKLKGSEIYSRLAIATHLNFRELPGIELEVRRISEEALRLASALCDFIKIMTEQSDAAEAIREVVDRNRETAR